MKRLARALAKLIFGNEGLSKRLERAAWIQALAKRLRVRELMNAGLARYPIKRQLPDSGVRYSIETFETLAVERAYFGNPIFHDFRRPSAHDIHRSRLQLGNISVSSGPSRTRRGAPRFLRGRE